MSIRSEKRERREERKKEMCEKREVVPSRFSLKLVLDEYKERESEER
jgi:hypothetical protein